MKKNAILIAGILFVAGCASQGGYGRAGLDSGTGAGYSSYSDSTVSGNEVADRDHLGRMDVHAPLDPTLHHQYDPTRAESARTQLHSQSGVELRHGNASTYWDDHNRALADSSVRGGSNEARGLGRPADFESGSGEPMNPAFRADSSIRGGSFTARDRDWNHRSEPSSGIRDYDIKADSSIRGGSNEARGGRERSFQHSSEAVSPLSDAGSTEASVEMDTSASYNSDASLEGSIDNSANWGDDHFNPSTSFDNDGIEYGSNEELSGAANTYSNPGSEAMLEGNVFNRTGDAEAAGGFAGSDVGSASSESNPANAQAEKNASSQLEKNISGQFQLEAESNNAPATPDDSAASESDPNSADSFQSSTSSERPGDISHGSSATVQLDRESTAVGSAAAAQSGAGNSDATERDSFTSDVGVNGSAAASASTGDLAQRVKSVLTRESSGTHGLMRHEVARNVTVTSEESGQVTLKGSVPSQKDKDMIEIRAREIPGVSRVINQLAVSPGSDPLHRDLSTGNGAEEKAGQLND